MYANAHAFSFILCDFQDCFINGHFRKWLVFCAPCATHLASPFGAAVVAGDHLAGQAEQEG
jgi:hypothetical protein